MKRCRRVTAIILVLVMVVASIPVSEGKTVKAASGAQADTWLASSRVMKNSYIGLYAHENGKYSIGTTGGNPDNEKDSNKALLYGYDIGSSSYTTFRLGERDYVYNASQSAFDVEHACHDSAADRDNFHIEQKLSFIHNSATGRDDVVELRYTVTNNGKDEMDVGCRILMDTQLGGNDSAPFRIPGIGSVTTETEFEYEDIPQIWQAFDSLSSPSVISQGRFYKSEADRPDKVQFANWKRLYNKKWEYTIKQGAGNGDSAVAMTWYEKPLAPGEKREYVTYYGLSELSQDLNAPLTLSVYSEAELEEKEGEYIPNPFPVNAYIENIGEAAAKAVSVKLELPKGLQLADGFEESIVLDDIQTGGMVQAGWQVAALPVYSDKDYKIRVVLSYDNGSTKSVTRTIHVPAATKKQKDVPPALAYTLFSESTEQNLSMYGWKSYITGDIYTGKDYIYSGSILDITGKVDAAGSVSVSGWQLKVDEKNEKTEPVSMPDLKDDIIGKIKEADYYEESKTFSEDTIKLSKSIRGQKDITFAGTTFEGNGYVVAGGNISCGLNQGSTYNNGKVVMYSESGDITLNGSEIYLDGILYAPEGTVCINANIFHLKGRILAKHIVMNASQIDVEGQAEDAGYIFDAASTDDSDDSKGIYTRTFTLDDDFSEGKCSNVSQRMDDMLVLEYVDSEQMKEEPDVREYDATQEGTGFAIKDTLNRQQLQTGNEEVMLTYELQSFVDGKTGADSADGDGYNDTAPAAGRKIIFETTVIHGENLDVKRIHPEADFVMKNENGSVTLQWKYDRLTAGDDFVYKIPLTYKGLSEEGMFGITRNTALLYYDTDGSPHMTYLEDRYVAVTNSVSQGNWEVICDAGKENTDWAYVEWNGVRPDDSDIKVEVSVSDDGSKFSDAVNVVNGSQLQGLHGRYLKVKAVLTASASGRTPELHDLTVSTEEAAFTANAAPLLMLEDAYEAAAGQPISILFAGEDDAKGTAASYSIQMGDDIPPEQVTIEERGALEKKIVFWEEGTYQLSASVSDGEMTTSKDMVFRITDVDYGNIGTEPEPEQADTICPVTEIASPASGELIDGRIDIVGTAVDDRELFCYLLTYRREDEQIEHLIVRSEDAVNADTLGTLDTSGMTDGNYIITLTAFDSSGNQSVISTGFAVEHKNELDVIPPLAEISNIAFNEDKSKLIITGTVKDENKLENYSLTVADASGNETVVAEGKEPIEGEQIGQLDTHELESGDYILVLCAVDDSGNAAKYKVQLEYKKGNADDTGSTKPPVTEEPSTEEPTTEEPTTEESTTEEPTTEEPTTEEPTIEESTTEESTTEEPTTEEPSFITKPAEEKTEFSLTLNRSSAGIGDSITGVLNMSNIDRDTLKVMVNGEEAEVKGNLFSYAAAKSGEFVFTATATDKAGENVSVQAVCRVFNLTDKIPPVVAITSPTIDTVLTEPVDFVGSAYDAEGLDFWKLEYRMAGEEEYMLLNEGTEPVKDGVLGHLDTTMLMNGQYNVRLTVQDEGGNTRRLENDYVVEGEMKVGAMHIGFTDITAQMGGTTVSANRMYDSRNKTKGDFGYGWTLGMQGMEIMESHSIADGYEMVRSGSLFSTGYQMTETVSHDVVVTYGDGTSDRFELTFSPERKALVPISEVTLGYKCVTDQKVKLEIVGDTTAYVAGSELMFYNESMYGVLDYKLTTADGIEIYLNQKSGVYKMADSNGKVITVDEDGYHAEDGRSIAFTRDKEGRIVKAEDPSGRTTTYEYDKAGDLVSVTDAADRTVTFTYDKKHNLASITDPMGIAVARNEYDDDGRLVATIDADGNRTEYEHDVDGRMEVVADRLGNKTVYVYDDYGNVLSTTDANGNTTKSTYDSFGNVLTKTDAKGNVTAYAYDADGNMTGVTDADGNMLENTYNSSNQVTSMKALGDTEILIDYDEKGYLTGTTDAEGNETTYTYDRKGNVTGITDELGTVMSAKYDKEGNVIESTDSAGNKTTSTYDESGNRLSQTVYVVTENGTEERTTHYVYDTAGELVQTVDADGNTTSVERNANGKMSAAVDSKGRRTEYEYDKRGNVTKITYSDGTTETFTYDAEDRNIKTVGRAGLTTTYSYDKMGNLLKQTDARGNTVSYTYDSNDNLLTITDATGAVTTYAYDKLNRNTSITDDAGNVTSFTYNGLSLQTSTTDARGNVTKYKYDANGNRTKVIYPDGTDIESRYDERGRTIWQKDAAGRKTEYTYDGNDRLTAVEQPNGAVTVYTYDQKGNLTAVEDANGNVTRYEYDTEGRRTKVTLADGSSSTSTYDKQGMLTETVDYNGVKTTYTYDDQDRIVKEQTGEEYTAYEYDTYGRLTGLKTKDSGITYRYNKYGELEQKTYENGEAVKYLYDRYGRTSEIQVLADDKIQTSTKYEYDKMSRLTRVIGRNGEATVYTYDANGNRETATFANGIKLTYTYDDLNRLILQKSVDKNGTVIAQYAYTLGKNGERTKVTESGACGKVGTSYDYDKANRLVKEVIERNDEKEVYIYTYDAVGNRISKSENGEKTEYAYNSRNQLVTETSSIGTVTYSYDANGSLLNQSGAGRAVTYTYDVYNRLTVYQQGEQKESYTYDAEGVRRSKTTGTDSIYFVSDTSGELSQTLAETDGKGNVKAEYTRADSLTAQVRAGEVSYYLYDGHGDVRALLNEAGKITDQYRYNAYGELLEKEGDTENHYLYTGEYYDGTSNLYYLRARYMNPATGNFLTMDTYEGSIYDPDTLHKYLYANGNPVTYSDPSGNFFSAVGTLVATTISTVYNNFDTLNVMGIISGLTNSTITAFLGGSDMEITKAFLKGYATGFGLGAVMYVVAAYEIMTIAQMCMIMAAANTTMSMVMTIGAIVSENKKEAIVYGTLSILSLFTFCKLYNANCTIDIIGEKGNVKVKYDNSNPENLVLEDTITSSENTAEIEVPNELVNGKSMKVNDILDVASDFLGEGYTEPSKGSGRFVSQDGTRVFRMGENDILGRHAGGPHVNFEILAPNPDKPGKMKVILDIHIYLEDF